MHSFSWGCESLCSQACKARNTLLEVAQQKFVVQRGRTGTRFPVTSLSLRARYQQLPGHADHSHMGHSKNVSILKPPPRTGAPPKEGTNNQVHPSDLLLLSDEREGTTDAVICVPPLREC